MARPAAVIFDFDGVIVDSERLHCETMAEAMAHSAINRKESRGSHQRLDGYEERDDVNFLKHTLSFYNGEGAPTIDYSDVKITKSQPAKRVYGSEGEKQDEAKKNG